ncbi:DUF1896 family protein [Mucilaginibacter defluvii]|uniref:Uncharacterized protein n=1 Tax=Mucilaginibacter defluvii TaxID=1196019 RepID=A0ABP9FP18_9SPHI
MEAILMGRLWAFIAQNNPDLRLSLENDFAVQKYLEEKVENVVPLLEGLLKQGRPLYAIEELCMNELTRDLYPSKFNYIAHILEVDFEQTYEQYRANGLLTYEVINMINVCNPLFEQLGFSEENAESRQVNYAITGAIAAYLQSA